MYIVLPLSCNVRNDATFYLFSQIEEECSINFIKTFVLPREVAELMRDADHMFAYPTTVYIISSLLFVLMLTYDIEIIFIITDHYSIKILHYTYLV